MHVADARRPSVRLCFFSIHTATTEIYTLSLHDALPISPVERTMLQIARSVVVLPAPLAPSSVVRDRKSTRLNSSHLVISYAVFCLKKKRESHTEHNERQMAQRPIEGGVAETGGSRK